jgi:hypothetical protein
MITHLRNRIAAAIIMVVAGVPSYAQLTVDLELSLLVDVSGSIDATEYNLQKQGYVQAFQSAGVQNAILAGSLGRIAVSYIEWSGSAQQSQLVGWTLIDSVASANNFAAAINGVSRAFSGQTSISGALDFATPLFFSNSFTASRQVIDISGDGANNSGRAANLARDDALAAGVDTINGIVILGEGGLQTFYQDNVVGGANAFLEVADSFGDFAAAIDRKLVREISNVAVPEPSTYGLMGAAALLGMIALRRRKAVKS